MKHNLRVMMFSWEFPPRVIGGISPHVFFLSKSLAKNGVKVYVVTCDFPGAPAHEVIDGVEVLPHRFIQKSISRLCHLGLLDEFEHAKRSCCHR